MNLTEPNPWTTLTAFIIYGLLLGGLFTGSISRAEESKSPLSGEVTGAELKVENPKVIYKDGRFEVQFELSLTPISPLSTEETGDKATPFSIKFITPLSEIKRTLELKGQRGSFSITIDEEPLIMIIDEEQRLKRRPSERELPFSLFRLLKEKAVIKPPFEKDIYEPLIEYLKSRGFEERSIQKQDELKGSSVIVFGHDPLLKQVFGSMTSLLPHRQGDLLITLRRNPWKPERIIAIVVAKDRESASEAVRLFSGEVPEALESSTIELQKGRVLHVEKEKPERGIKIELRKAPRVIEPPKPLSIKEVVERLSQKRIIYIGEYHDRFSHHYIQLQLIKELYKRNKKIAIGMEMFQRPFQKVLDEYINGRMGEREFLKETEYFKRWGFDYNLYKPILDFAKEQVIPIVALNLRREITEKVSKGGIDSLTEEERKEIPADLDFSDNEYRERLKEVFKQHKLNNFDYFYQAQILWDETMAMSIDEFLKDHPDYQMIVLAGGGHIAYGSGIPKRVFRRNGLDYGIVLIDAEPERGIADFIIYPDPLEGVTAPRLMVSLKEDQKGLRVIDLPEESISRKAGIKKGDVIVKIDDTPISRIEDLRLLLFYKKPGDTVKVTVLRRYFLLGEKEKEFLIKF